MNKHTMPQRIGALIEKHICETYHLKPNNKRGIRGYYDAYDTEHIYEIKAASKKYGRLTIETINHQKLVNAGNGKYFVVLYDVINKDRGLQLISDIHIINIENIDMDKMNTLIANKSTIYERKYKNITKKYLRIKFNDL
jgi:hypothetical protein